MKVCIFSRSSAYSGSSVMLRLNPGPSLLYTSISRSYTLCGRCSPAQAARFPPLECPPMRSLCQRQTRAISAVYSAARTWAGTASR